MTNGSLVLARIRDAADAAHRGEDVTFTIDGDSILWSSHDTLPRMVLCDAPERLADVEFLFQHMVAARRTGQLGWLGPVVSSEARIQ